MNITPEQLREIAERVNDEEQRPCLFQHDAVRFTTSILIEFQKLQGEQEPFGFVREVRAGEWKFSKTSSWTSSVWNPVFTAPPDLSKRIAELEAECGFDQRNAAQSQAESLGLLQKVDELAAQAVRLREVAVEVREACLFVDDAGEVRVSNEPCIDSITFDNMCAAIKSDNSADWLRKHDAQVLRNATKEVEQMWSDNFGRDCESAYARVLHKLQSMAKELEGEMK